ncbi:MAG: nitroreductase family protein [Oscillospiraceae bacterium]|nr:nitroreductase family protein [Oscillospiraceae bacterium]
MRGAIEITDDGPALNLEKCNKCGHCVAVCPVDAIDHPLSPVQPLIMPLPPYEQAENYLRQVRSVRLYKPEPIPQDQMKRLVDIGRFPQTGGNSQGVSFHVLEGREKIVRLIDVFCEAADEFCPKNPDLAWIAACVKTYRETGYDGLFRGCTSLIFALSKKHDHRGRENAQFALTFIALMAPVMGYATCWAGIFERLACDPEYAGPFADFIGLPEDKCIRGAMMAGIPAVTYRRLVERDPLDITFQ